MPATRPEGDRLEELLAAALERLGPVAPGDLCLVAFSGGADSTALLALTARRAEAIGARVHAAHLDHGLDTGSRDRAEAARRAATRLGVPVTVARREVAPRRRHGESPEAAARRVRYSFLSELRGELGADWILTAHHADDQAETVLLRLLAGGGWPGLAGIPERRASILRPLLGVHGNALRTWLRQRGLGWTEDPTNQQVTTPRNRVRRELLPELTSADPALGDRLDSLAAAARTAADHTDTTLLEVLEPDVGYDEISVDRRDLEALTAALLPFGLALLHRLIAAPPPTAAARCELARQLAGTRVDCDTGHGWHWRAEGPRLVLARRPRPTAPFAYTLRVPGGVAIPEIGSIFEVFRADRRDWMTEGSPRQAGLELPLAKGQRVIVRSRRSGDRIRPLGHQGDRPLKRLLIDRRVPRHRRDALPLLVVEDRLAWIPGVAVAETFKIQHQERVWVARWAPLDGPEDAGRTREDPRS